MSVEVYESVLTVDKAIDENTGKVYFHDQMTNTQKEEALMWAIEVLRNSLIDIRLQMAVDGD